MFEALFLEGIVEATFDEFSNIHKINRYLHLCV